MAKEIERKFRLVGSPSATVLGPGLSVRQAYILTGEPELRLRLKGDACYMTVKSAGDLVRDEWETEIPRWVLDALWPTAAQHTVEKTRHAVSHAGSTIEVDVYTGTLAGLVILECEFQTEEAARGFTLPEWARPAVDVTTDPRYKNKALAAHGLPI